MVTVDAPNRRSDDRFRFSPAYTRVVVIPSTPPSGSAAAGGVVVIDGLELGPEFDIDLGTPKGGLEGHGYDISMTGMRFELDEALPVGSEVTVQLYAPAEKEPISMRGTVVRVFSADDDPGPRRMGVQFTGFVTPKDRERLSNRINARACCWPK